MWCFVFITHLKVTRCLQQFSVSSITTLFRSTKCSSCIYFLPVEWKDISSTVTLERTSFEMLSLSAASVDVNLRVSSVCSISLTGSSSWAISTIHSSFPCTRTKYSNCQCVSLGWLQEAEIVKQWHRHYFSKTSTVNVILLHFIENWDCWI